MKKPSFMCTVVYANSVPFISGWRVNSISSASVPFSCTSNHRDW